MRCFSLAIGFLMVGYSSALSQWERQSVAVEADFRGLCVVSSKVVWVSGTKGTYGRTIDGGQTWTFATVPDAAKLDFRDVKAFSEDVAYLLSAGPGEDSRIFKTADGGKTWSLQFKNPDADAFYDAMAFWDDKNGVALGDPVRGRFQLIMTVDGGMTWKLLPDKCLPQALPDEGAFAASGSCIIARGKSDIWFGAGGGKVARLFHSSDRGQSWSAMETPILAGGESAGIFGVAFRDANNGIIVGGDYRKPHQTTATAAITADAGKTWKIIDKSLPYRSGVAWANDRWIAVGTTGSDAFFDSGAAWQSIDRSNYNSVRFAENGEGWAVGPKGLIAKHSK